MKNYTLKSVFKILTPKRTRIRITLLLPDNCIFISFNRLQDPAAAIPKGTMLALLLSMFSYALFVVFAGGAAMRDASGNVTAFLNGTLSSCAPNCTYGLLNSYSVSKVLRTTSYPNLGYEKNIYYDTQHKPVSWFNQKHRCMEIFYLVSASLDMYVVFHPTQCTKKVNSFRCTQITKIM